MNTETFKRWLDLVYALMMSNGSKETMEDLKKTCRECLSLHNLPVLIQLRNASIL